MGGCASRPKEFDADTAPETVEATETETTEKVVVAAQEEGEVQKEAPLVDLSEPAEAAPTAAVEAEKKEEEEKKDETDKAEKETAATSS